MSSVKCPGCGLANFSNAEVCRRCGVGLSEWERLERFPVPAPPGKPKDPFPFFRGAVRFLTFLLAVASVLTVLALTVYADLAYSVGAGVAAFGIVVLVVGCFRFLYATFQVSLLWLLGCLFVPFVGLVFVFLHWDEAKRPLAIQVLGLGLTVVGAVGMGGISPDEALDFFG